MTIMKLINKDALVAEIERRIRELEPFRTDDNLRAHGAITGYYQVLSFIDTIEAKEVDLDKEVDLTEDKYHGFESLSRADIIDVAKHFFELGMAVKALQDEPVSDINFEQELYKAFGQVKDFTLGMRIAKWFYDMGKKNQEHVSEELEEAMQHNAPDNIGIDDLLYWRNGFITGVKWHKAKMMANTADATIGLPYENKDGGYTHLVDVSRPLPIGENKIAIIFKEN